MVTLSTSPSVIIPLDEYSKLKAFYDAMDNNMVCIRDITMPTKETVISYMPTDQAVAILALHCRSLKEELKQAKELIHRLTPPPHPYENI